MKNAYDVLSDPTRRQLYENYLLHSEQPPIAPPPPPNFNSQSTQTTNTTDLSKHKSLIELLLANDTAAIKRKLAENPDFNYLYNAWRIDNSGKTLNALDVAVRQGKFDIVKMLIAANYNISNIRSYYSEFAGGGGCTSSEKSYPTIVIAAVYYNKDIFDFLMNELQKPTKKTKSKNTINKKQWIIVDAKRTLATYLLYDINQPLRTEVLDAFATIDLKIYNCDLAYPFINYYSHKMKNYVEKCGPGRFLHYFLRGGSLLAINKMLELGYQFTSTNEDNESPYLALCDLDPIHCSIRNSKVNEQRFTEGAYSHITRENVSVYKYYKSWLGN